MKHIVRFKGGLANQLFQLCLYEKLKDTYGNDSVYADISYYKTNNDHGGYKLKKYITLRYIDISSIDYARIDESNYNEVDICGSKEYLYDGYWQSEVFFPDSVEFILDFFDDADIGSQNAKLLELIKTKNAVSVHVRRGDYVDNYHHGNIANKTYLLNAVEYISKNTSNPSFFVFSDDILWCKENLNKMESEVFFVAGNKDAPEIDILLMSYCKHNIIANSSFSWWAQKLNKNPEKIVIAPEYWFNDENKNVTLNRNDFVHVKNIPSVSTRKSNPRFSVIVPVYNRQASIKRCLSSVLNQTYENIEVIIVDDASTDNTFSILRQYGENDARITLIENKNNSSVLASRIIAMKQARSEYVMFIDSDDYYSIDALERINSKLQNEQVDIVEFSYMIEPQKEICKNTYTFGEDTLCKILEGTWPHMIWNKCFSKNVINQVVDSADVFYCNVSEDTYLTFMLFSFAKSYKRMDDVLYHYVTKDGMSTSKVIKEDNIERIIKSLSNKDKYLVNYVSENTPHLINMTKVSLDNDLTFVDRMCRHLDQPISKRIKYLKMIDDAFGTSYAKHYEDEIIKAIELYEQLKDKGIKSRIKHGVNYIMRGEFD